MASTEPTLKILCKKTGTSYNKKDVLGMGSYGIVFSGFHRDRKVAVKRIEVHRLNPEDREVKMQMKLEHENVLKMLTVEKDDDFRYIRNQFLC
jgi:serine/threonine protein kinase